jgi:hypothetical protein
MHVAFVPEAAAQLGAVEPEDRLPYAITSYAGMRRSEFDRLEQPDVLDGDQIATRSLVSKSKSPRSDAPPDVGVAWVPSRGRAARDPPARTRRETRLGEWERSLIGRVRA